MTYKSYTTVNAKTSRRNKLATISGRLIPAHLKNSESEIVHFLKAYYRWLDTQGIGTQIYGFLDNLKIDSTPDDFMSLFRHEFLTNLPANMAIDPRFLVKYVNQFYKSKGTEEAIKFIFKILFDDSSITITYPKEDILRCSDGTYRRTTIMRVNANVQTRSLQNRQIFGRTSNAVAIVETTNEVVTDGSLVANLNLSNVRGTFIAGEQIETRDGADPYVLPIVLNVISGYSIAFGGTGYGVNEKIPLLDDGGGSAEAIITVLEVDENGSILSLSIDDPGAYYSYAPTLDTGSSTIPSRANSGVLDAIITLDFGTLLTGQGIFEDSKGFLSDRIVLQDGELYQEYSYVVSSRIPVQQYIDILIRTVHPAGVKITGLLFNDSTPDSSGPLLYHLSGGVKVAGPNYKDPSAISSRKFWEPKIVVTPYKVRIVDLISKYGENITAETMADLVHEYDTNTHVSHVETYINVLVDP